MRSLLRRTRVKRTGEAMTNWYKIGLSFFEAKDLIVNVFENDVKLDYCVTPDEVYQF